MERACLFVCLFVVLVHEILGQVGSLCRSNERLLSCGGCQKTCLNPVLECKGICKVGCYCNEGEVRNATGQCVKLADCPPMPPTLKQDTTEPRDDIICAEGEEYRFCEPCNRTCDNPNPICPAQCARGCFCRGDMVRDRDGTCVSYDQCSNKKLVLNTSTTAALPSVVTTPIAYQLSCGPRQIYKLCENCEKTCSNPNPRCPAECRRGCFCNDGYYKAPNGKCVKLESCPKAATSIGGAHLLDSIEDCDADEEYYSCGWCEPSCSDPEPRCPLKMCTTGCLCKPPLVRHRTGHCVHQKNCAARRCLDPNEEYVCRYGCEARCEVTICVARPKRCTLGCHCKQGLIRDSTGMCVTQDKCTATSTIKKYHYNRFNNDLEYGWA